MQWNRDINGHGTHVAGIILDVVDGGDRNINSNNIDLFVVSAFDGNDVGYESDVVRAVRTCVAEGKADVVNLSLGNTYPSQFTARLYENIVEHYGALLVAAAGNKHYENSSYDDDDDNSSSSSSSVNDDNNNGSSEDYYDFFPASIPSVISVGAVQRGGVLYPNSVRNNQVEFVGPGHEILSMGVKYKRDDDDNDDEIEYVYERRSGTSSAAPHVTGAVALLKSHFSDCSNRQIRYAMAKSAVRDENSDNGNDNDNDNKSALGMLGMLTTNNMQQDSRNSDSDSDSNECDSTKGYGNIQVRDAFEWMLLQGRCDSWDVERVSRGGCTTLEGGIVRIQPPKEEHEEEEGENDDEDNSVEDNGSDSGSDSDSDDDKVTTAPNDISDEEENLMTTTPTEISEGNTTTSLDDSPVEGPDE